MNIDPGLFYHSRMTEVAGRIFRVRYKIGLAPAEADTDDVLEVEAAMFVTNGTFIDFYSDAGRNVGGTLNASGDVVFRVSADIVADIREKAPDPS
jgi:hypothetical protein